MRRVVAVAILVGALLALWAAPASAHAALASTEPVANQSVDAPPEFVELTFTEPVSVGPGGVRLYDSTGRLVDTGSGVEVVESGSVVQLPAGDLGKGSYVVTWRVLSEDEHPVQGAFTFAVGQVGVDVSGLAERLLAAQGASVELGVVDAALRFLVYAFLVLLVGPVAFAAGCWRAVLDRPLVRRMLWIGWAGLVITTAAAVLVRGPYNAGLPIGEALDSDVIADVLDTRFGRLSVARLVLLLLAFPLLRRVARDATAVVWAAAGAIGLGVVFTISGAGHAASGDQVPIAVGADVIHLGAAALWLGGLVVLAIAALRGSPLDDAMSAVRRFSRLALVAVVVIVTTGIYQAWRLVRELDELVDTDYGRLVIAKVVMVAVVVLAASFSRDLVQRLGAPHEDEPAEEAKVPLPVGPGAKLADDFDARTPIVRRLRRSVGVEVVFAIAVLGASSVLVSAAPPVDARNQAYTEVVRADGVDFDVLVTPGGVGRNDIHVQALDPSGTLTDVVNMQVWVSEPSRDIALIDVPLRRLGPGHYFSPGFDFPFEGDWTLDIRGFETETQFVDASTVVSLG